ncbi:MAG TPA: HNH endonuclease, partial [Mycobacterium sp.]|nr:HNH endonuclease [Mycobacterium sp.]
DAIELKTGVAYGLARQFLHADVPDVAGHLFGRERIALAAVREPFKEAFGAHCFYCGTHLRPENPMDNVLPWSVVGIDGLANLVLSCPRCNGDKRNSLPAVDIVDRVLARDRARGLYRGQPS